MSIAAFEDPTEPAPFHADGRRNYGFPDRIVRRGPELRHLLGGMDDKSIDRAIAAGVFPKPSKIFGDPDNRGAASGWSLYEICDWIQDRMEGRR